MAEKRFGSLSSSVDPSQLANTVKGGILALSGVIIYFAANFVGLNITQADVIDVATVFGALAGAVWAVYGLIQKLVVKFAER